MSCGARRAEMIHQPRLLPRPAPARIQFARNGRHAVRRDALAETRIRFRVAAPPEKFFHRPALEHLADSGSAAARTVRRKFRGDQQAWEIFRHSIWLDFAQ